MRFHILQYRYQMFEINMDEYLDEEVESVKLSFQVICRGWAEKAVGVVGAVLTKNDQTGGAASSQDSEPDFNRLELLLSLDVALELIRASRDSLKRVEIFAEYPGHYGHRVRDTIEEIFILMLQALNERHVSPGFKL
jgi:hypothetical protein